MNETTLQAFAKNHGLTVFKRITTGVPGREHAAEFELSCKHRPTLLRAWEEFQTDFTPRPGFQHLETVNVAGHEDYGQQYILIQSVWCEVNEAPKPAGLPFTDVGEWS